MCPFECFVHSDKKSKLTFSGTSVHRGVSIRVITLEFRVTSCRVEFTHYSLHCGFSISDVAMFVTER